LTVKPVVNLEIAALGERHHTGIANVAKSLAREILGDTSAEPRFWFNRQRIPNRIVESVLQLEGAPLLWWIAGRVASEPLEQEWERKNIGIYPSHKFHRRFFRHETFIVHDLSALTMPQFHTPETVEWENGRVVPDILSSDLLVAVSRSTLLDVQKYIPRARHIPAVVAPLASCVTAVDRGKFSPSPYILVLGTLEPRKNVEVIFELLRREPGWLNSFTFVFAGRWGWGDPAHVFLNKYGLEDFAVQGRIQFPGFVSDQDRDGLVSYAKCVVYPSKFEGFGLPVLEALAVGTPVVTGDGSSLREAGGTLATYVDVTSAADLGEGLRNAILDDSDAARNARIAWASGFSWRRTYETIRDAALAGVASRDSAGRG
jgi:glycosyltransferase involved in cell wall biosynthesis